MSLEELAQASGSSKSYMWELENKPVARPSAEKLGKIAAALGVTPDYLLDEKRTAPSESEADHAFFRKYQSLDDATKQKISSILNILDKED